MIQHDKWPRGLFVAALRHFVESEGSPSGHRCARRLPMFMTHLECSLTGERYDSDRLQNLSRAGRPLLARYDLDKVAAVLTREELAKRPAGMWKWRELLPLPAGS